MPASQTATPPERRPTAQAIRWMIVGVVAVMVYTLLLGWGLVFKIVPYEQAYLWMAVPCLAPIALYLYGFVRVPDRQQDFGLLLSAMGWILVALALIIKHSAIAGALQAAGSSTTVTNANPPATTICLILAVICLVFGGVLSWTAWARDIRQRH
ncbi:MAG: hypothetical protein M3347_11510 [Armatimonadota bacterium]|nr:hypothetical protein [Armatimonadota bacterium]